jgi:outer membrane biosynthesis protein TonB
MRQILGILLSIGLHLGVVASALVYFPAASRSAMDNVIIPIELVTLSDTTNVRAARPEPEPEIAEPEPEPAPVQPEPEPETLSEAEPEIIPPAPEPEPEPVQPEPEPEPEPVDPDPTPEPEPEPEPVQPEPEPEPQRLDLGDLSRAVGEARNRGEVEEGETRNSAGAGTAMTATLQAMAASQIQRCVRSNADAPVNMDLAVVVQVTLERNGEIASPPSLVDERRIMNSTNPYLRVAGERALRAVIECAPYQLPPQNYQEWRRLEVNIDTQRGR